MKDRARNRQPSIRQSIEAKLQNNPHQTAHLITGQNHSCQHLRAVGWLDLAVVFLLPCAESQAWLIICASCVECNTPSACSCSHQYKRIKSTCIMSCFVKVYSTPQLGFFVCTVRRRCLHPGHDSNGSLCRWLVCARLLFKRYYRLVLHFPHNLGETVRSCQHHDAAAGVPPHLQLKRDRRH